MLTLGAVCAVTAGLYLRRDANPGCEPGGASKCTRIFFIGNSYTSVNDLPTMFANLAWSGGHRVETGVQAPGGWTLADHDRTLDTDKALAASKWDLVVLQEQSEIPSDKRLREANMYPAAHDLVVMARNAERSRCSFSPGHRNGWPAFSLPDYTSMQSAIDDGYLFIAGQQHAEVAPVGLAWMSLVNQDSDRVGRTTAATRPRKALTWRRPFTLPSFSKARPASNITLTSRTPMPWSHSRLRPPPSLAIRRNGDCRRAASARRRNRQLT